MFYKIKNVRINGMIYVIKAEGYRDAVKLRRQLGGKIVGGKK